MECTVNPMPMISILIVEDEAITLEVIAITLANRYPHLKLYKAPNGKTGLELFRAHTPDIVITDINMPEMGGVHMADKIRAMKPDTKIIVLTAYPEKHIPDDSAENCPTFDFYIEKPILFKELFDTVDKITSADDSRARPTA